MSKSCTVSASKEPDVNLGHNYREFGSRNWPSHIDQARTPLNVEYTRLNLNDVYEELFSDSVKKADAEQSRKDRKIGSASAYLDKVTRSKQQSPVYEHILQFGDMFSHGWNGKETPSWKEASEMLDEVAEKLKERYPQLKTVCLVKHLDEATPHLHWSYVPFATDYAKGMPVRVGLDKSLQQMGYKANHKYKTPSEMWLDDVRSILVGIAKEHGYTIESPIGKTQHQRIQEFKREVANIDDKIKSLPEPDLSQVRPVPFQKDKVIIPADELDKLKEKATLVEYRNSLVDTLIKDIENLKDRAVNFVRKCREALSKLNKRLEHVSEQTVKSLEERLNRTETRVQGLEKDLEESNQTIAELRQENKKIKDEVGAAYSQGTFDTREKWIDIIEHFGLHTKKEFRDYVNEVAGKTIIEEPDRNVDMEL